MFRNRKIRLLQSRATGVIESRDSSVKSRKRPLRDCDRNSFPKTVIAFEFGEAVVSVTFHCNSPQVQKVSQAHFLRHSIEFALDRARADSS